MENKENTVFGEKELNDAVRQYKKQKRGIYLRGIIAFCSFVTFFVLLNSYDESKFPIAMFCIILCFACIIANIVTTTKMKIQTKKNLKASKQIQEAKMQELKNQGMRCEVLMQHMSGLGTAENVCCRIQSWEDSYKFEMNNVNFNLQRSKVTDVSIKTETELQQFYVSSVGGAALGGALFGTLGAAYGGRVKKKEVNTTTYFVVFTYTGEAETDIKNIIFEAPITDASKLVSDFHANKKYNNTVNIEL